MPFQLNRVIPAINDLLGAKTWPNLPAELEDRVRLGFDVRDLLVEGRAEVVSQNGNLAAVGLTSPGALSGTVDEARILLGMGLYTSNLAAGNTARVRIGLQVQLGGTQTIIAAGEPGAAIVGERLACEWQGPLWDTFQNAVAQPVIIIENFTGAVIPYTMALFYTRIRL